MLFPTISPKSAGQIAAVAFAAAAAVQATPRAGKGKAVAEPRPTKKPPPKSQRLTQSSKDTMPQRLMSSSPIRPPSLGQQQRGTQLVVQPAATYGDYSFASICAVGKLILDGKLKINQLRDPTNAIFKEHRVPASSMAEWCKDDSKRVTGGVKGSPHWLVERDVSRRTDRTKPGPGPILGAAEDVLMLELGNAAKKSMPYELEEVTEILRNTCIRLQLKDHLGKPYTQFSDVSKLCESFLARCRQKGVWFVAREGQKLFATGATSPPATPRRAGSMAKSAVPGAPQLGTPASPASAKVADSAAFHDPGSRSAAR